MPDRETLARWERENPDYSAKSARASEIGALSRADECEEIAEAATTFEEVAVATLRIRTRQWNLSKLFRKKFGESSTLTVEEVSKPMTLDEFDRRLAAAKTPSRS